MSNVQSERSRPTPKTDTPRSEFWAGARDVLPLIVGAIPFGIIFGTLAISSGLSVSGTLAMSALVFTGSSQFIAVGMIVAKTGWLLIVLTAFVVNLRHLLYAVSLVPYVKPLSQRWKIPLAFLLTDEAFAIAIPPLRIQSPFPFQTLVLPGGCSIYVSQLAALHPTRRHHWQTHS